MVLVVQMLPFAIRDGLKMLKINTAECVESYSDLIREKTKKEASLDRVECLRRTITSVDDILTSPIEPRDYSFKDEPIHYTLQAIARCSPIDQLNIDARGIHAISSLIEEQLRIAGVNPFIFITSCYDHSGKSNHFVDILLCRKLFYEAIQHNRIDCIVINEHLFDEQAIKVKE